jgi:hypothetical protein
VWRRFFRQSRYQSVDKATFASLSSQTWKEMKGENLTAGFRETGLQPLDPARPTKKIVALSNLRSDVLAIPEEELLQHQELGQVSCETLCPVESAETIAVSANK